MNHDIYELLNLDTSNLLQSITETALLAKEKGYHFDHPLYSILFGYYAFRLEQPEQAFESLNLSESEKKELFEFFSQSWNELSKEVESFSDTQIQALALQGGLEEDRDSTTEQIPVNVCLAVLQLMNVQSQESFADISFTSRNMGLTAAKACQARETEIARGTPASIKIREAILQLETEYQPLSKSGLQQTDCFDQIFLPVPFGLKELRSLMESVEDQTEKELGISMKNASAEWKEVLWALSRTTENGNLAIWTNLNMLWNEREAAVRQALLEKGWIHTVIQLPEKLLTDSAMASCILLLSRRMQDTVRLINANAFVKPAGKGRRAFSQEGAAALVQALLQNSPDAVSVGKQELIANGSVLLPDRWLHQPDLPTKATALQKLVHDIRRGTSTLKDLRDYADKSVHEHSSKIQVISSACIQDGLLELPEEGLFLNEMPKRLQGLLAKEGDLIISRNGSFVKSAVVDGVSDCSLLVDNSLILVQTNPSILNPYYLQAYLESDNGRKALQALTVGNAVQTLSAKALARLMVPGIPLSEQNKTASEYQKACILFKEARQAARNALQMKNQTFDRNGSLKAE